MSLALLFLPACSADRKKSRFPFGRRGSIESGPLNAPRLASLLFGFAGRLSCSLGSFRGRSLCAAAAPTTCSQQSRTINMCLSRDHAASAVRGSTPVDGIPKAASTAAGTRAASTSVANPTNQIPSTNDALISSPAAIATVVFPIPPGPTMVTRRCCEQRDTTVSMISSRPTTRVRRAGRLPLRVCRFGGGAGTSCSCSRVTGATKL